MRDHQLHQCDCGYVSRGDTENERIEDAQRHALEAHGIDVTPEQVVTAAGEIENRAHEF